MYVQFNYMTYYVEMIDFFLFSFVCYEYFVILWEISNLIMQKLTLQEEEAMLSVWQLGGGFVKDILDNLKGEKPPYTTLASTIRNLERKGYVKSEKYANAKRYVALISEEEYKATFMKGFVGDYFRNSYKEMVSFFVKEEKLSAKELEEIMDMIKNNKC